MRRRDLLTQVLTVNLLLVVAAVVAAVLATNPDINLGEKPEAGIVLGLAVGLTILINLYLLQRRFGPLERLGDQMERADLSRPRANLRDVAVEGPEEVVRLHLAFRRMLERLEAERRRASSAALEAQEEERARVARDLHDEVNQSLTGLVLRIEAMRTHAPPGFADELAETRAVAGQAMEELLALARQLRPTALDDLGLGAALAGLVEDSGRTSGVETSFEASGDPSTLPDDVQLFTYRIVQEALSNAIRHADASSIRVNLIRDADGLELRITDDGSGLDPKRIGTGLGLAGMRERALLVGGRLELESRPPLGTRIRLTVPAADDWV